MKRYSGFAPTKPVATEAGATATIAVGSSVAPGTFNLVVNSTDGALSDTLALPVTVNAAPMSLSYNVMYSSIDPNTRTGRVATVTVNVTGGVGPFSYAWAGGASQSSNRLGFVAPVHRGCAECARACAARRESAAGGGECEEALGRVPVDRHFWRATTGIEE